MTADLDAVLSRAENAYEWVRNGSEDGFLPLSVREHFNYDMPALIAEVQQLRAQPRATTHLAARGQGAMACCGRTPFELPGTDRMAETTAEVTCNGQVAR